MTKRDGVPGGQPKQIGDDLAELSPQPAVASAWDQKIRKPPAPTAGVKAEADQPEPTGGGVDRARSVFRPETAAFSPTPGEGVSRSQTESELIAFADDTHERRVVCRSDQSIVFYRSAGGPDGRPLIVQRRTGTH